MRLDPWRTAQLLALPLALGTGCTVIEGNGQLTTEERQLSDAVGVSDHTAIDMQVTVDPSAAQQVLITCDSNALEYIETRVEAGVLVLGTEMDVMLDVSEGCLAEITLPELRMMENTGSATVQAAGDLDELALVRATGSGDTFAQGIAVMNLEVKSTGSGDMSLAGVGAELEAKITGSGEVAAQDLVMEGVTIKITGSGDGAVYATERADVKITGSGDVHLYGNPPQLTVDSTGSGELRTR